MRITETIERRALTAMHMSAVVQAAGGDVQQIPDPDEARDQFDAALAAPVEPASTVHMFLRELGVA